MTTIWSDLINKSHVRKDYNINDDCVDGMKHTSQSQINAWKNGKKRKKVWCRWLLLNIPTNIMAEISWCKLTLKNINKITDCCVLTSNSPDTSRSATNDSLILAALFSAQWQCMLVHSKDSWFTSNANINNEYVNMPTNSYNDNYAGT